MRGVDSGATLIVQDRDIEVLTTLVEARLATQGRLAVLHFDGKPEAARKRLERLASCGLILKRQVHGMKFFTIGRPGFETLRSHPSQPTLPVVRWSQLARRLRLSPFTIQHELAVSHIRASILTSARECRGTEVDQLIVWPERIAFRTGASGSVKPDGFLRLRTSTGADPGSLKEFFIEVDRSTESQAVLLERAVCYRNYYQSGDFAKGQGISPEHFKRRPFRVLVICRSAQRRDNLAATLLSANPKFRSQIWLSTFDEVARDPFGPVWLTPKEFERGIRGSNARPLEVDLVKHPLLEETVE